MVNNASDSTWRASVAGSYGLFIADYLKSIHEPFQFLDIGANQGVFSLVAALNPNCRQVVAFEPNPRTFSLLTQNARLSPRSDIIHPFCGAVVAGSSCELEMRVPLHHSGAASMTRAFDNRESRSFRTVGIGSDLFADVCKRPDGLARYAKIDVEGAELIVFGALKAAGVLREISALVVEVSEQVGGEGQSEAICDFLAAEGFELSQKSNSSKHYDGVFINKGV